MKVFELLTMINKPRYKVKVYDRSDLRGGVFAQGELEVGLLNRKVADYRIYKPFKNHINTYKGGNKMKTSEFINRVKELGYEVVGNNVDRIRVHRDSGIVATVFKNKVNKLDSSWNEDVPHELFDILINYASTPIEERKERKDVKKYYLYNPVKHAYFNYHKLDKYYLWFGVNETISVQTMFTEEEIENHNFKDIMELLEKVEVE